MDLYAYTQIEDLATIAAKNNISVPRLRGYRLMKNETPVSEKEIEKMILDAAIYICEHFCRNGWHLDSWWYAYGEHAERQIKKHLIKDTEGNYVGIRWDNIHGKKRKNLKFEIKRRTKAIKAQYETWNKYVGRADVMYIHARIGGNNWNCFKGYELTKEPWFLEKVDDNFDSTYCDIYAVIKDET